MTARQRFLFTPALGLCLAAAASRDARGQFGGARSGFGVNPLGNPGSNSSLGYGIRTGQMSAGYGYASGIYGRNYAPVRAQTTVQLQPLFSAITSLPGWNGPTTRVHRRVHRRPIEPKVTPYDRDGKILWPSTIPADPDSTELRRAADDAFRAVVRESQSTGHASIRPVIDTKNKLSAFERKILPDVKAQNVTDGENLERFFGDLNWSLDAMNSVF
jgi:hypothetical protein